MSKDEKKITTREEDYSQWYLDVIAAADLAEHSPVKGCMVIKPYGYAIWEAIQKHLDAQFKKTGVKNAYFPMLIPERLLKREENHIEGFAPEVAMVTHAGGKKLDEPLVVRPTSETIIYETISGWIHSYRDLPLLLNQWANVVRWEMRTRLFLRTTEFLWQEGHTVHATASEADDRARQMLEIYRDLAENYMAIPVIPGVKSASERFAGAQDTYTIEAMMQDGKALQFATSHNLGQNFSKPFEVSFLNENQEKEYGYQTSWGLSTRSIGGLIMVHGDDKGIIVPPKMASIQTIITTIAPSEEDRVVVDAKAKEIEEALIEAGIRAEADLRPLRPGEKFFEWEKKGVPLRLELGPKDLAQNQVVLVRRDTGEKHTTPIIDVQQKIESLLVEIQDNLFATALARREENTVTVDTWEEFTQAIENDKFVFAHWSGDAEDELAIKEATTATIRCVPFDAQQQAGVCVKSGKSSTKRVLFAKSY